MANGDFIWDAVDDDQDVFGINELDEEVLEEERAFDEITKPKKKKDNKVKKKKNKTPKVKRNTKWKKYALIIVLLLTFISIFFLPLYKVDKVVMNQTYFVTQEQVEESIGVTGGGNYGFRDLHNENINGKIDDLVSDITTNYDQKTKTLYVDVEEIKPLASTPDGNFYYLNGEEVKTTKSFYYTVPKLIGFDEEMQEKLVNAISKLDYKIIKEIAAIEYVPDETIPDLVAMQMMDGNIVYITISEIPNKMPYYLQMSQIIDEKAVDKPGIIHLERGNYYEPI